MREITLYAGESITLGDTVIKAADRCDTSSIVRGPGGMLAVPEFCPPPTNSAPDGLRPSREAACRTQQSAVSVDAQSGLWKTAMGPLVR